MKNGIVTKINDYLLGIVKNKLYLCTKLKYMIDFLHKRIRTDLIINQKELLTRYHYYTHKYRSNDRLLDINVGIFLNDRYQPTVQIYIANSQTKIREQFILDKNNNIIDNNLIIKHA